MAILKGLEATKAYFIRILFVIHTVKLNKSKKYELKEAIQKDAQPQDSATPLASTHRQTPLTTIEISISNLPYENYPSAKRTSRFPKLPHQNQQ